MSSFFRDLKGT